jgi:hypothetical protein
MLSMNATANYLLIFLCFNMQVLCALGIDCHIVTWCVTKERVQSASTEMRLMALYVGEKLGGTKSKANCIMFPACSPGLYALMHTCTTSPPWTADLLRSLHLELQLSHVCPWPHPLGNVLDGLMTVFSLNLWKIVMASTEDLAFSMRVLALFTTARSLTI